MQLLLFTLLFFQSQVLQTERFRYYDTEDGLSNNIVYDIYQDYEGFVWVATENGLNRFDGYEFVKYFRNTKDSTSLSSNIVRSIVEDKEGNLWVGTYNGLNLFHKDTQNFERFVELPSDKVNRLDLQQMIMDDNGRIWFSTLDTSGWFDTKERKFHFLSEIKQPFSIAIDNDGFFWVQTFKGELFSYQIQKAELRRVSNDKSSEQLPIHWGKYSKTLWANINFDERNIIGKQNDIPILPNNINPLNMLERNEDELLLSSNNGLFSYSLSNDTLIKIDFREKNSSLINSIRSLFQDRNGGLWVGTLNGFFHFDPYQKLFSHIDLAEKNSDVIMGVSIIENELLANTFSNGLKSYELTSSKINDLISTQSQSVGFFQVWDIAWIQESEFQIWLATNEGLFIYNQKSGKLKKVELNQGEEAFPVTFSIEDTSEDYVWVSSLNALYKLSKKKGEIEEVITIKENIISSVQDIQVAGGNVLVATEGEGIFVYDPNESLFLIPLRELIPEGNILLTVPIWDIFLGVNKQIWIGTNQGLYKMDDQLSKLSFISSNALRNRIVFSIEQDKQGNLWLGTEKGLMRFNPETEEILEFNKRDGVLNIEYNRRSVTKSKNGTLFFGGVNGITVFNPDKIIINPVVPDVYILEARVITSDSSFIPKDFYEKEIILPWDENTLEFNFVGLNYTNPSLNKYRYKLEGHDPDWVNSETRLARYAQLSHGSYTFKVQASNNDGLWNTEGASLYIKVNPPFWKTIWFRLLLIVLIAIILWGGYRYRLTKLLELERVKLRIASDLHDEVGSGLSGIALTGDILQRQLEKGQLKPELIQRITKNSRVLASSLDAIVWLIDSKKETIGDLISKSLITAKDLIHHAEIEVIDDVSRIYQRTILTSLQRRNLFLLIKEALNNSAKHSRATHVTLAFEVKDSELIIRIEDNGLGFDTTSPKSGRGLGTLKSRADELKAIFVLTSNSEEGTKVMVSVKIP